MPVNKIEELKKAVDDLKANIDKIGKAKSIDEVTSLEQASSTLLPAIQQVVVECAWDLKRAVNARKADLQAERTVAMNKELGL